METITTFNKNTPREIIYESVLQQARSLIEAEKDLIATLANITSLLKHSFDFFWVGFYIAKKNELVLGPFQGTLACTRIPLGKGVCGTSFQKKESIVVGNVDFFPGHIACSSESKSEIVVPIIKNNEVQLILDIDSDKLNDFSKVDAKYLELLAKELKVLIPTYTSEA